MSASRRRMGAFQRRRPASGQRRSLALIGLLLVAANACGGAAPAPITASTPVSAAPCPPTLASATTPVVAASGSAPVQRPGLPFPPLTLSGTQVRDLPSDVTGKTHQLQIGLPASFASEPERRYPVLYVLDGQWDFPLVLALSGGLRYDQVLPELLVVGLSWAGEEPDYDALRSDDYLPTRARHRSGNERGGGATRFLSFLEVVVIPLLEREYRADPERRVIAGASNGGLFALHALFEKPDLFAGYIAISPNVGWDDREILRREAKYRAAHPRLDARLWLSSGSAESPDYLEAEPNFFSRSPGAATQACRSKCTRSPENATQASSPRPSIALFASSRSPG